MCQVIIRESDTLDDLEDDVNNDLRALAEDGHTVTNVTISATGHKPVYVITYT